MTVRIRLGNKPNAEAPSMLRAALAGVVATYAMDLAGRKVVAPALGKGPSGGLGRWIGHMLKGRFTHEDITKVEPVEHEAAIGIVAHYGIGLVLGAGYALLLRVPQPRQSSVPRATAYGVATTVFPWFLMFPARGQGVMGLRDGDLRVPAFALCTHVAYGLGLGGALQLRIRGSWDAVVLYSRRRDRQAPWSRWRLTPRECGRGYAPSGDETVSAAGSSVRERFRACGRCGRNPSRSSWV